MLPPALQDYRKLGVVGREDIAAAAVLVSMAQREGEEQPELLAWLGFCLAALAVYVTVIHALILIIFKSGQVELILVLPMHLTGH